MIKTRVFVGPTKQWYFSPRKTFCQSKKTSFLAIGNRHYRSRECQIYTKPPFWLSFQDAPGSRPTSSRRPFYKGPVECLHKLYHHGGIRTCYSGFWIQGARDVPASATYFMIYENLSAFINRLPYSDSHGVAADLLAGGTAGVVSWTLILPLDVIKSQVQANAVQGKFNGAWHCAKETYLRGGVRVFFTGLGVASLRAFPTNAVIFLVYSQTSKVLNRRSG